MAINIKFDSLGNSEPPTIVLANRNGNKLGQLDVNVDSIDLKDTLKVSEFTFTLNKYVDGKLTNLWDKVVDFKLVYCKEWDTWFEIKVELDEATETVKTVFCTQLGQAELSQIMLYNIEINTEKDIERDDYKISILYDEDDPKHSTLHRILEKAPHYSIAHVDHTIARIQRSFPFDDTSICDALDGVEEEVGCLVVYNSNSDENGMPNRTISVYDLQQNCKGCGHRGEFTDKCPKCNSTDITYGYGEDTTIFVTSDELATEGIQLVTDTDSVKNCFKLEAGDDLMTATIRNCNPNGTDYIWYFSDAVKEDMSNELVNKIESYDELYKDYYNNHVSTLDANLVTQYNALVTKYKGYYNTPSTCLNCDYEGEFEGKCPQCGNGNILTGKRLQTIATPIVGYANLMNAYYNTIDLAWYLKSSLMPSVEMSDTSAEEQLKLLTASSLSPVAVNVNDIDNISLATATSSVLSMAKVLIRPTYKVDIVKDYSELSNTLGSDGDGIGRYKIWYGKFVVTNYSDETDTATSDDVLVRINNDTETFIKQKIEKALNKEDTDDYSISGLFEKEYDEFCSELKKYALNPLTSFYDACEACISILTEQGAGDATEKPDLYEKLYKPYFDKSQAIAEEMKTRQDEIDIIEGVYDVADDGTKSLRTDGLQTDIARCKSEIQEALNFENYLGTELWLEFCSYRREDKYSNDNYISDGLNNAELFQRAREFVDVAENEIFKSAELQHSITATLNNLLAIPKFKPLIQYFKTGNWIRVQIDDKIYKLRLLEYEISYGDFDTISVEFSDVTKIKNGTTDLQDVFSQASSMASSYDSVQRQAQKGDVARTTIDQWFVDGLDSANVRIKNNNNEEVTLTKSGLLARSYSDITGTYSPEQFRLTHNIMAYTTDNWATVTSALGKHGYKYWDGTNQKFVDDEAYGLTSKFVAAGYITGSQIISGEIISSNYKKNESGTYINLNDGTFDFGGGKIVFNDNDILTLKNVTILWDDVNSPEIANVSGLTDALKQIDTNISTATGDAKDYTDILKGDLQTALGEDYKTYINSQISTVDSAVATHLGMGGNTVIGERAIISPYIGGGYLNITEAMGEGENPNDALRVLIDPNNLTGNDYVFQVLNGKKEMVVMGVDKDGNAVFTGTVYATDGEFTGTVYATDGEFTGTVKADGGTFKDGTFTNCTIDGGSLLVGSKNNTTYAEIDSNGKLTCANAKITGEIIATSLTLTQNAEVSGLSYDVLSNKPTIPTSVTELGFNPSDVVYKGDVKQTQKTDANGLTYIETSVPSSNGNVTYATYDAGDYIVFGRSKGENSSGKNYICVSKEGLLTARNALIYGTIYATDGEFTGKITAISGYIGDGLNGFSINSKSIYNVALNANDNKTQYYMTSVNGLNSTDRFAGGSYVGDSRNYIYIGTDGVGTIGAQFAADGCKIVGKTYIKNGELHTNSGTIGEGSTYSWKIGSGTNNAYLYCGTSSIAGDGGLIAIQSNSAYFGTNGLSFRIDSSGAADYTTVIKSGHVLTYGDNDGGASNHRATHLYHDGIEFFYVGSSKISDISNLANYKVGGISIDTDEKLNLQAINGLKINVGSLVVGSDTAKTGWVRVLKEHDVKNNTFTYAYLRFANGILVYASTTPPPINTNPIWILQ